MRNLNQDVLNEERRNMFKKLKSIENKLSLYNKIFLNNQNPYKYFKIMQKRINNNNEKNKLKLISEVKNSQFSLPIKITKNNIKIKENKNDIILNNFKNLNKIKLDFIKLDNTRINNDKKIKISKSCINKKNNRIIPEVKVKKNFLLKNLSVENNLFKNSKNKRKISVCLQTQNSELNKNYSFYSEFNKNSYDYDKLTNFEENSENDEFKKKNLLFSFGSVINKLQNSGLRKLIISDFITCLNNNKKLKLYNYNQNNNPVTLYNFTEGSK